MLSNHSDDVPEAEGLGGDTTPVVVTESTTAASALAESATNDDNSGEAPSASTTTTARPRRGANPAAASALAQQLADEAVGVDAGATSRTDPGELSTAPARTGCYFYPNASTHVRLSQFTTKGPTDTWAGLVVGLLFLIVFIWGTVTLATFNKDNYYSGYYEALSLHENGSTAVSVGILASLLGMIVLMGAILYFPQFALLGIAALGAAMLLVAAIVVLVTVDVVAAILILALLFFQIFYAFLNRHTLMRCTETLRTISQVWRTYPAMLVSAFCLSMLAMVFVLLFTGALIPYAISLVSMSSSFLELFLMWMFLMIFAWFMSIFPCLLSVIVGGVTATWYALEGDPSGCRVGHESMDYTNLNPTFWMAVRAFWTNCGTACLIAALSVQSAWWHWLAEGLSEVKCLARFTCWQDCMRSLMTLAEMAYRTFNLYSLMRVSIEGDDFIHSGPGAFELVNRCRDLAYFRHRLHVLTPLMVMYAISTATMMMACFGSVSWSLGCYSLLSSFLTLHTFSTIVPHTCRALLYCYALDRQPMTQAAPALQLEIDSVREEGERRFTEQAAARAEPVIV